MLRKMEWAMVLVLAASAPVFAQQRETTGNAAAGGASAGMHVDEHVADSLLLANYSEIALCQFAENKLQNEDVRQLAKEMMEDHQKFVTKLRKFASKDKPFDLRATKTGSSSPIRQVGGTTEDTKTTTSQAGGHAAVASRIYHIEYRAAQECLKLTEECLDKEKGKHFDQAFLGQQIGMHIHALSRLMASEDAVSPEFQQVIKEGEKTTKEHKERVEKLMKKLAESSKS